MPSLIIIRIVGFILMLFSSSTLIPLLICFFYQDGGAHGFIATGILEAVIGFVAWFPTRKKKLTLKTRDGFLVVALIWIVLSFFASLPFIISPFVHISFTDAFFEAISGLTTTGATIFTNIDSLPHAMLFYRQELQFMGGMGIVVLAVAVLPMLSIGGMQLYRAETPGPMKDSKLTPRITETAKALWIIYVVLTIACIVAYWLAGMTFFDAVGESFGTISTGGFSMHEASFAFYNNHTIDVIAIIFMFLSGVSFALHFSALQQRKLSLYWRDLEFRYYFWIVFSVSVFTVFVITMHQVYPTFSGDLVKGFFNVVSLATTTGFTDGNFSTWPSFIPITILFAALIGACGGSTSGGLKVMRFILVIKQMMREMQRLIHPNGVYPIKFGDYPLSAETIEAIWGFIAVFIAIFIVLLLLLMISGLDLSTSFSAAVASLANTGAGIGTVASSFEHIPKFAKWVLSVAMLAGRLEIFTLLLLFTPDFWRK